MSDNNPKRLRRKSNAGLLAGVAGVAAVGSIAGVTVARSMTRRTTSDDIYAGENFELLDADRGSVVTTPDGVDLAVREVGPEDAPLTVVFSHGFCLRMIIPSVVSLCACAHNICACARTCKWLW